MSLFGKKKPTKKRTKPITAKRTAKQKAKSSIKGTTSGVAPARKSVGKVISARAHKPLPSSTNKSKFSFGALISVRINNHKDKKGGHPHVIVDNIDNKHVSVGLTTQKKKGKNNTNYPLTKDPLNNGKHSYMRRQGTVAPQNEYDRPQIGQMTTKDYSQAKAYGDKAKQKYLDKNDKKK